MPHKHEVELRQRAERFAQALSELGVLAAIVSDSFRDYLVKVSVARSGSACGHVNLYYSPKENRYSLRAHELRDQSVLPALQACWDQLERGAGVDSPSTASHPGYALYVDGSCIEDAIGYGIVILKDGEPAAELCGPVDDPAHLGMRQVGGELWAVRLALSWAEAVGAEEATVCYDYTGLEKWATGEWRADEPATRAYAQFVRGLPITVRWQKVEGHGGDPWNDRADKLAKQGAKRRSAETEERGDPLGPLEEKAKAFVSFLEGHGITATYAGIFNGQFARVVLSAERGCVDLYNTRKRPLSSPYLHGFSDKTLQTTVETLWRGILRGDKDAQAPVPHPLGEAGYYYEILKPYGDCAFDFLALASALERACCHSQRPGFDGYSSRYDFPALEAVFRELEGGDTAQ